MARPLNFSLTSCPPQVSPLPSHKQIGGLIRYSGMFVKDLTEKHPEQSKGPINYVGQSGMTSVLPASASGCQVLAEENNLCQNKTVAIGEGNTDA